MVEKLIYLCYGTLCSHEEGWVDSVSLGQDDTYNIFLSKKLKLKNKVYAVLSP